ncbi:uncharacterized protein EKO05_0010786 [Ascochyta rabiei]|uniref:Uncharacterized protein n=1 Tax=Didymella rabiei TaxID=5454 RepID=A0A163K8F2_DIDRA|nr:uncharacterized protein EKO05_0010786 [Ascochyta rabiei]KZM26843.1 hypothetical protein ST47_g2007 [Ascochyta rabiei]UPX20558.1 hypothetical protein EKO05_0010786 [Ascochyta rabiei]
MAPTQITKDITLQNQIDSPFLRLPGEVRNRIYGLVLGGRQIQVLYPRLYSAERDGGQNDGFASLEPGTVRKLLHMTEACRQIHAETDLLVFQTNDFRIASNHSFETFLDALSQRQAEAVRSLVWPKCCQLVADGHLSKCTGLQRLIVSKAGHSGGDFYTPADNATVKVHLYYQEMRQAAQDRIDAWEAKGVEIEYCE